MTKLTKAQTGTIEEYWYKFDDYKNQLKHREWELKKTKKSTKEDPRYQHLKSVVAAIESVCKSVDETMKKFAYIRYLSKEATYIEWEDVGFELNISLAKAYKMRSRLMDLTAAKLGWI